MSLDSEREPTVTPAIDKRTLNALMVRLDTLQRDHQRQIDDLRERLKIVEEDLGLKSAIDWNKMFNAGPV